MPSRKSLGLDIKQARKKQGSTQKEISTKIDIPQSTLSEIENGRFTGSLDIFERYIDAVGLELTLVEKTHRFPDWDELDELFGDD